MPNLISYTNKDFAALKAEMISHIPELAPRWTNLNEGELGMALLNLVAGVGDMLAFYLDRYAEEMFLPTAVSRESVKKLARLIDYRLHRPVAARTKLRFSVASAQGTNITIPKYTVVQTKKGVYFTTKETATLFAGQTFVDVDAFQGEYVTQTFSGTGEDVQTFVLSRPNVAQNFLEVYVGSELWREDTRDLDFVDAGLYEVDSDSNEQATLKFSRYLGSVPSQSASVQVHYAETLGSRGNIGAGLATVLVSSFTSSHLLTVTNVSISSGGQDRESTEEARTNAPRALRTQNRAVTLRDYEDLLTIFPGVIKAKAINHAGFVELYVAPELGGKLYVEAPVIALSTVVDGAATLDGTYLVRVTGKDVDGETTYWEYDKTTRAVILREQEQAVAAGNALVVTVTNPEGATHLNVYLSDDDGETWTLVVEDEAVDPDGTTTITLQNGAGTPATPPEVNTTGVRTDDGSQALRRALVDYLDARRNVGCEFAIFNPEYVPVNVTATVKVYDNYRQADVQGRVQTALTEFFAFANQNFGQEVTVSDLYTVMKDVEGVRSISLTLPADDVVLGSGEIAVQGVVTLTMQGGVQ